MPAKIFGNFLQVSVISNIVAQHSGRELFQQMLYIANGLELRIKMWGKTF